MIIIRRPRPGRPRRSGARRLASAACCWTCYSTPGSGPHWNAAPFISGRRDF